MAKIKIYLRRKVKDKKWFMELANKMLGTRGTWKASPDGFVWTHSSHDGKGRFLMQYDGDADFVKVWHPSRDWFMQAQAIGDFVQWTYDNASDYVRKIEIPI